jgi:hypothetical protein
MGNDILQFKSKDDWSATWNQVAAASYQQYRASRGALFALQLDIRPDGSSTLTGLFGDALSEAIDEAEDPEQILLMVQGVDPAVEVLVLIEHPSGEYEWRKMRPDPECPQYLEPKAAYELIGDQGPEPTGPAATIHRFPTPGGDAA